MRRIALLPAALLLLVAASVNAAQPPLDATRLHLALRKLTVLGSAMYVAAHPDELVTRFPTTGEGGHGPHTASAILAVEAFKASGDPTKFPEQLKYMSVWQPRRIFWNHFTFQAIKPDDPSVAKSLRVDLGTYSPLIGRSYMEIAAESRSQHKSQGFGVAERRGSFINYYDQLGGDP